jgi:nucleotide-binding universal stress UspA family protein
MIARGDSRILVPIDFGPSSEAALTYAKMLAASFDASLYLLHVLDDVSTSGTSAIHSYGKRGGVGEACALDPATRLCNLLSGDEVRRFHVTGAVVFGSTAASITKFASERGIDLIVMGTNRSPRLAATVPGSVAEYVVRTAHCPVLTVRDSGAVKLLHRERSYRAA